MSRLIAVLAATAAAGAAVAVSAGDGDAAKRTPVKAKKPSPAAVAAARASRLEAFPSCDRLLSHVRGRAIGMTGPYGMAGYATAFRTGGLVDDVAAREVAPMPATTAAPAAPALTGGAADGSAPVEGTDFSGTNVQETGVDEPDILKSDGRRMFTISGSTVHSLDVARGGMRAAGKIRFDDQYDLKLLLSGDRLLVVGSGPLTKPVPQPGTPTPVPIEPGIGGPATTVVAPDVMIAPAAYGTVLTLLDVSNPAEMRVVETSRIEGQFVGARMTGRSVRVVVTTPPDAIPFEAPAVPGVMGEVMATARNREIVAAAPLATWVPTYTVEKGGKTSASRPLVDCDDVRKPPVFSGLGMLTVATIDLARGAKPVDSDAVETDAQIVYGSATSLYVATTRWFDPAVQAASDAPKGVTTQIHRFDTSKQSETAYRGSGRVTGFLLSQWAMSEKDGVLRVASTREPEWWANGADPDLSESYVTTLTVGQSGLTPLARVGGLGRGERIHAVRFIGNAGYVVTFRQTDPLYVVDLENPAAPRVRGELKIPGYSAYLHPVGDGLLVGVGQDADDRGRVKGTQISLFDVSDPERPQRLHNLTVPSGWSEAEGDHHAFLHWTPTGLTVVPVQRPEPGPVGYTSEALGVKVGRDGIRRVGAVTHPAANGMVPMVRRSAVVGSTLYTLSDSGVMASRLGDMGRLDWQPLTP